MKIAQIAPVWSSAPYPGLSDPERALSYLTDELVRRGHEVTLFASADSRTSAKLEALCSTPFRWAAENWDQAGATMKAAEQVFRTRADEFDILHSHLGIDGFTMTERCPTPTVTTLHNRLDWPGYISVFKRFRGLPLVSTSDAQRQPLSWASWQRTVYPGAPSELYRFHSRPGTYLAFIGSVSLEKGLGLAIELARRAHLPLRVASRHDGADEVPLALPIELLSADSDIEWVGELNEEEKQEFIGGAFAYVCTQLRPGLSGLSFVEALACGTPVLTFHGGNATEMIDDHVTGFVCDSLDEMVDVLPLVGDLDRNACREVFEKRFSAERMADQYVDLYERLLDEASAYRRFSASIIGAVQNDRDPVAISS